MAGMAPRQKARKGRYDGVTIPGNTAGPTVTIASAVMTDLELVASGTAIDPEAGDLSATIVWSSDVDGVIGTGASITVTLSEGAHVITASATDGIKSGEATTNVTATAP